MQRGPALGFLTYEKLFEKLLGLASTRFNLKVNRSVTKIWFLVLPSLSHFVIKCLNEPNIRSSRPEVFWKKGVFRNFTKFTRKHLCQCLIFNKVACLRSEILLKQRLWHRCFSANFAKFLRSPFLPELLWWLIVKCETITPQISLCLVRWLCFTQCPLVFLFSREVNNCISN